MSKSFKYVLCIALVAMTTGCNSFLGLVKSDAIEVNPQDRTFGSWIDDQSIETTVSHNVDKSNAILDKSHVEVHSFNGVVLLTGEVPNADARSIASAEAQKVPGVRIVHNELAIRDNSSLFSRTGDSYLHKAIKIRLFGVDILDGVNIDVIVEDNVAYLMGLVTRAQGDAVAEAASRTRGLRQVVKVFEYVD